MSIEPLLGVFDFDSPSFGRLKAMLRRDVIREAVAAGLPGLVFSYVLNFDDPREVGAVEELIEPVVRDGGRVDFVELYAA